MVIQICNHSPWEPEVRGSEVQGQAEGIVRPNFKTNICIFPTCNGSLWCQLKEVFGRAWPEAKKPVTILHWKLIVNHKNSTGAKFTEPLLCDT